MRCVVVFFLEGERCAAAEAGFLVPAALAGAGERLLLLAPDGVFFLPVAFAAEVFFTTAVFFFVVPDAGFPVAVFLPTELFVTVFLLADAFLAAGFGVAVLPPRALPADAIFGVDLLADDLPEAVLAAVFFAAVLLATPVFGVAFFAADRAAPDLLDVVSAFPAAFFPTALACAAEVFDFLFTAFLLLATVHPLLARTAVVVCLGLATGNAIVDRRLAVIAFKNSMFNSDTPPAGLQ